MVSNNNAKIQPQKCDVKYFGIFFQGKIILEGGFMKHKGCCVNLRKAYHFSGRLWICHFSLRWYFKREYGDNRTKSMFFYEIWYDYPYIFRRISYFNDTTSKMRCQVFWDIFCRIFIREVDFSKPLDYCLKSRRRTEMRARGQPLPPLQPFILSPFQ